MRLSKLLLGLLDTSLRSWASLRVVRLVVGLHYVYARLEDGHCGLASTPLWEPELDEVEAWEDATPRLLARMADQGPLHAAAALAAVNAATSCWIDATPGAVSPALASSYLEAVKPPCRAVVVGYMPPLASRIQEKCSVTVVEAWERLAEEARRRGLRVVDWGEALEEAVEADLVVASGTIVYKPGLALELFSRARRAVRVLVGPTAGFHPDLARRLGASFLAGASIPVVLCRKAELLVERAVRPEKLRRVMVKWGRWLEDYPRSRSLVGS